MSEDEPQGRESEASLELPSFGLRRRRRRGKAAATVPETDQSAGETAVPSHDRAPDRASDDTIAVDPVVAPPAQEEPGDESVEPAAAEPAAKESEDHPTQVLVPPTQRVQPEVAQPARPPQSAQHTPTAPRRTAEAPIGQRAADEPVDESPGRAPAAPPAAPPTGPRRRPQLPALGGGVAALVTGLVVGLVGVGLTLLALLGCEAVVGTSSCGDAGFFLLAAILVVMVVLGRALLDGWAVREPGSTSFLAVGLVTVVALLFLVEVIFSWTMVVVIPAVSMAAFALSQWITATVGDSDAAD